MNISLFSQSLFALDLDRAVDATVEAGYDAVELACRTPHLDLALTDDAVSQVAARVRKAGLSVSALSLFNDFTTPQTLIAQIRQAERGIRLAALFDTDVVKLTPGPPASAEAHGNAWSNLQSAIDLLTPVARRAGIRLAVETHMRQLTDTVASAERVLGMAEGGTLGLTVDFSNLAFAGEPMAEAIDRLGRRMVHAHVKNGTVGEDGAWHFGPLDQGLTDYSEVLPRLHAIGYDGYLSVECLGPDAHSDPVATAARDLTILKDLLNA